MLHIGVSTYTAIKKATSSPNKPRDTGGHKQNIYSVQSQASANLLTHSVDLSRPLDTTTATRPPSHAAPMPTPPPAEGCTSSRSHIHWHVLTTCPQFPPLNLTTPIKGLTITVSCYVIRRVGLPSWVSLCSPQSTPDNHRGTRQNTYGKHLAPGQVSTSPAMPSMTSWPRGTTTASPPSHTAPVTTNNHGHTDRGLGDNNCEFLRYASCSFLKLDIPTQPSR